MSDRLSGIRRLFLDSAPVIYFIEKHPVYYSVLEPIFDRFEAGELVAVTSPVTLAECLVLPMRLGSIRAIEAFFEILGGNHYSVFVPLERRGARIAAEIRSRYDVTLTDAFQIAAAFEGNCDAFLTNDKGLTRITDLTFVLVEELAP